MERGRGTDPLLVTLRLDEASTARLDALRRSHFPAGRTVVGAHVMLFHALPGGLVDDVVAAVGEVTDQPTFAVDVTGVRSLGRGVAYRLRAPELTRVHATLAGRFGGSLTAQDAQPFAPHVTVQNKVDAATARATLRQLTAGFVPWQAQAVGLDVWWYRGGPWEPLRHSPFASA